MQKTKPQVASQPERISEIACSCFFRALNQRGEKVQHYLLLAEKWYGIAMEKEPHSPVPRNNRALVREVKGDFEAAFLDFAAAKRLCNGNADQASVVEQNSLKVRERISPERQLALLESIQIA